MIADLLFVQIMLDGPSNQPMVTACRAVHGMKHCSKWVYLCLCKAVGLACYYQYIIETHSTDRSFIVSAWTCMIMEFQLVDGVQFFLVLSVLVALPPLW